MNHSTGYGPRILVKSFDGDANNYDIWEDSFMATLRILNLHLAFEKYADERPDAFNLTRAKQTVYDYLTNCLDRVSHGLIKREAKDDGVKALKLLRRHYLRETQHRIYGLWRSFINSRMEERDAASYLASIDETVAALKEAGETISDGLMVVCTLDGLSRNFVSFVDIANQRNPPYKYEELKIALLSHEDRFKDTNGTESVMVLRPNSNGARPNSSGTRPKNNVFSGRPNSDSRSTCFKCGNPGHFASNCNKNYVRPNVNDGKSSFKATRPNSGKWCNFHRSRTHNTEDCKVASKKSSNFVKSADDNSNIIEDNYTFHVRYSDKPRDQVENTVLGLGHKLDSDLLLVDSGCTSHIETDKPKFVTFQESFKPQDHCIELADGQKQQGVVQGIGNVKDSILDEHGNSKNILLKDTLYIPGFKQGILSVWKTVQSGHSITFSPNGSTLTTCDGRVFNIIEKNKLFYLSRGKCDGSTVDIDKLNKVHVEEGKHTLEDWHRILGHCNVADILKLETNVDGMSITNKDKFNCDTCILGKMTQYRNRNPDSKATQRLELVHCDIVGPIEPIALGGFKYGLSFVDDYSGVIKVYLLKSKCDTVTAMRRYLADTAHYGNIKRLRCDNGSEFTSKVFKALMTENKIKQEFSSPYSPHQNGTAERSHRSIFDMARCMLIEAQLPKSMWSYAVKTACFVRNRCYNPRTGKTPVELLTGRRPNLSKMNIFGTKCFAYVQDKKKLDPRSKQGIFVGYDDQSPAYLVYFSDSQTVKRVRCVQFVNSSYKDIETINVDRDLGEDILIDLTNGEKSTNEAVTATPLADNDESSIPDTNGSSTDEDIDGTSTQNVVQEERKYQRRERNRPQYLSDYAVGDEIDDYINVTHTSVIHHCYRMSHIPLPVTYADAINSPDSAQWKKAMDEEIHSLKVNDTYELTTLPDDRTAVGGRWVFQIKSGPNGEEKFKARFVAKGYSQIKDIDYSETFAPTAKMTSVRMLLHLAVEKDLEVHV